MTEKFVAIGSSSLYAEYKGGNVMPDGSGKTPENGHLEPESHKPKSEHKPSHSSGSKDLPHKDLISELINRAQESNRSRLTDSRQEGERDNWSLASEAPQTKDIVYESNIPLEGANISFPVTLYRRPDGTYVMNKLPTNKYDRETITKIVIESGVVEDFGLPKEWENSTPQERLDYLKSKGIDTDESPLDIMPNTWGEPTPDPEHPENLANLRLKSFRELALEKWRNLAAPMDARKQAVQDELDRRINSADPRWVESAVRDLAEIQSSIAGDVVAEGQFDQVILPDQRDTIHNSRDDLRATYRGQIASLREDARRAQLGDINTITRTMLSGVRTGYYTIDQASARILSTAAERSDVPGFEGLRVWYAFQQVEALMQTHEVLERTQVQPDPVANMRAAEEVMRFFEKSKTPESFGFAHEQLNQLLKAVEMSSSVDGETSTVFRKRIESFVALNTLLITLDTTGGDPGALHNVSTKSFNNETYFYFYDRFNPNDLRDADGRRYLINEHNDPINLNILSEAQNAFTYQYLVDRFRVNQVQNLTLGDLNINSDNLDEQWIIRRTLDLADDFDVAGLNAAQQAELQNRWQDNGLKLEAVRRWYQESTLMGADGYLAGSNHRRVEVQQNLVIHNIFRQRLVTAGVAADRIDDMLGTYDPIENTTAGGNRQLVDALKRNAYDLAKFNLTDTIDKVEINGANGDHIDTIFGEETPYNARVVSQFNDFCLNELQGDPRVNALVRARYSHQWDGFDEAADGPRSVREGMILGQNLTAYRVFNQDRASILPAVLRTHMEQRVNSESQRLGGVPNREVDGYIYAQQLQRGIDPDNPTIINQFANIDWANGSKFMKSFDMNDMLLDRKNAMEWYMDSYRTWLLHPTDEEFIEMIKKFPSKRSPRRHPSAAELLLVESDVGEHLEDWFGYRENLSNAQMDGLIKEVEELNLIDRVRGRAVRGELLGNEPIRSVRQLADVLRASGRETLLSPGWWGNATWDFLKTLLAYLSSGK